MRRKPHKLLVLLSPSHIAEKLSRPLPLFPAISNAATSEKFESIKKTNKNDRSILFLRRESIACSFLAGGHLVCTGTKHAHAQRQFPTDQSDKSLLCSKSALVIKKKMPSISANQDSVILPCM